MREYIVRIVYDSIERNLRRKRSNNRIDFTWYAVRWIVREEYTITVAAVHRPSTFRVAASARDKMALGFVRVPLSTMTNNLTTELRRRHSRRFWARNISRHRFPSRPTFLPRFGCFLLLSVNLEPKSLYRLQPRVRPEEHTQFTLEKNSLENLLRRKVEFWSYNRHASFRVRWVRRFVTTYKILTIRKIWESVNIRDVVRKII